MVQDSANPGADAHPAPPVDDPRVYLAAERTFLAWVRTAVALMGFGFVIARFALFLREYQTLMAHAQLSQSPFSSWLGVGMILLGVVVSLLAALRHFQYIELLKSGVANPPLRPQIALLMAAMLAVVGIAIAVHLVTL